MYSITADGRRYALRVDITDSGGNSFHETYEDFLIGPRKQFVLHVGRARGNAGLSSLFNNLCIHI